ncbi:hypothetical protein Taro_006118 [Colocasia esculenta]|uniref:Aminotransferase-like plant mobile domain-containing protein n=1 Tax=Colocasia esculenta TaxID=4460 RepID=A0A843TMV4_COLES|nr:hypothetical protein [Colocasia esculenta]
MGFGEVLRMDRMRPDPALTQALRSRWDVEATAFIFPWGHMIPSLEDESLGLYDVGKQVGESVDGQLQRLTQGCRAVLAKEPGTEADLDLRRFLILFLGRLLFATRGDAVHCRFLPLLEELDEVWTYLHLPALRRGILARPGIVPIAHRWDPRHDTRTLSDQLASLQEAIDCYPQLDVVWQPYLEEDDEGQPYFGRSVWVYVLNLVLPLHLHLCQRSLGLRQSVIQNWERRGKGVKSSATTNDAYLQAYALKYGGKVYKSVRRQVDMAGETASLRALLYSTVQDRDAAQREAEQLRKELERVRRAAAAGASSSGAAGGSQLDLKDRLAAAVRRAEEAQAELTERERDLQTATDRVTQLQGQVDAVVGERDRLRIQAEAAEARVAEATRELATLRVQGSSVDQEELAWLRADLHAQ